MKFLLVVSLTLVFAILPASAQAKPLTDDQAITAAKKAFKLGRWNPEIFKTGKITKRAATLDNFSPIPPAVKKALLKDFGSEPFTVVPYNRRPSTIKTNGGEIYGSLFFLVFSPTKVATIDGRAYPCPKDTIKPKD